VSRADALEIALVGKSLGAGRDRKEAPIDLAVGVVLNKKVGDRVEAGEPLALIHARTEQAADSVADRLTAAFAITQNAVPRPLLLRRVTASGVERLDT
jgi:pyrimidine-nucleoside phosphorylase